MSGAKIMVLGVGSFASAAMHVLTENNATVHCYLTRDYGHYSPSMEGKTFYYKDYPNPCDILRKTRYDLIIPMSINWHYTAWTKELLDLNIPILSPVKEAMFLERDRDYARRLCEKYEIPVPVAHVARNRIEAEKFVHANPRAFVIKNPLCSPTSPIHTIVCESVEDTLNWLNEIDYAEGVFLQEYLGKREIGHIAFVSAGEIYPLVTNQEYKRAFDGNLGPVAGAPMGGIVQADPDDQYGLARELLYPLLPWFRESGFSGPVQVTAVKKDDKWHVIEYNVRTGVTTGPALWRMLKNPADIVQAVGCNKKPNIEFEKECTYACILTLAGWGYPYVQIQAPPLEINVKGSFDCDVWWNETDCDSSGKLYMTGHRIADVIALAPTLEHALSKVYENIRHIHCLSSYYRLDIGKSMWPPGEE